jgi:hypothetical protein
MCQDLTLLAEGGPRCRVAICEHGVVHVTWGMVTIHLRVDDLLALGRYLGEQRCAHAERPAETTTRLWVGPAGLALTRDEVPALIDLVGRAVDALADSMIPARGEPERLHAATRPLLVLDRRRYACN